MSAYLDIRGASGALYRYTRIENAAPPTAHSGICLYVREAEGEAPEILYVAEAENLMTGGAARWQEAVSKHGATGLFTRLHVAGSTRKAELEDVLAVLTPVMTPA